MRVEPHGASPPRTLVVFDCFGTVLANRKPLPGVAELEREIERVFRSDGATSARVAAEVVSSLQRELSDPASPQTNTCRLLEIHLAGSGIACEREATLELLSNLLGDSARYEVVPGVNEILAELERRAASVRLLSNCLLPTLLMDRILEALGILHGFELRFYSADGGPKKPQRAAWELAGRGSFGRRIMVGDDEDLDLAEPRRMGWRTLRVDPGRPDFSGVISLIGE